MGPLFDTKVMTKYKQMVNMSKIYLKKMLKLIYFMTTSDTKVMTKYKQMVKLFKIC